MGFTVYYQSTEPLNQSIQESIAESLDELCQDRTWLSCEPVGFFGRVKDGVMQGGSKPNFMPHPDDVADAEAEGLPDGTILDVVKILCQLSSEHQIDWVFNHDHDEGPIGFVRNGVADRELLHQIDSIAGLGNFVSESLYDMNVKSHSGNSSGNGDEQPRILKFRPID